MGEGNTTPWGNCHGGQFHLHRKLLGANGAGASADSRPGRLPAGRCAELERDQPGVSYARLKSPQAFVQDDFKVRPNLTINLGLRYTGTTGFKEINNSLGGFGPQHTLDCPTCGAANGSQGTLWFAPQNRPRFAAETDLGHLPASRGLCVVLGTTRCCAAASACTRITSARTCMARHRLRRIVHQHGECFGSEPGTGRDASDLSQFAFGHGECRIELRSGIAEREERGDLFQCCIASERDVRSV